MHTYCIHVQTKYVAELHLVSTERTCVLHGLKNPQLKYNFNKSYFILMHLHIY